MNAKHLLLGGVPASLLVGLIATLTKGRVHLTTDETLYYGGLAAALGAGIAHRIEEGGISGLFSGLWRGKRGLKVPAVQDATVVPDPPPPSS